MPFMQSLIHQYIFPKLLFGMQEESNQFSELNLEDKVVFKGEERYMRILFI